VPSLDVLEFGVGEGTDVLEDEVFRRARDGVEKPVFYEGVECGDCAGLLGHARNMRG
jgi:hypothetical protein